MKIALVGFSGSGKSTCFKAIVQKTGDHFKHQDPTKPHLETVKIPDARLEKVASVVKPEKTTHAELVLEDLPGFHIPQIKDVTALIEVIALFSGRDAVKDIGNMDVEFMLADLEIIQKRLASLDKESKQGPSKEKEAERDVLKKGKNLLEKDRPLRYLELSADEDKIIRGFQFLSRKPVIALVNVYEKQRGAEEVKEIVRFCGSKNLKPVEFCAEIEAEIADLEDSEKEAFFKEYGIEKSSRDNIIRAIYEELGLITFFTTKGEEAKSWIIRKGTSALEAAGKIHSDIKRGFIKAEVLGFDDFTACVSLQEARQKGFLKLEGKDYEVRDGDIIDFKFNV